jgi:hydrogenase expression/formation protein HypE
MSQTMHRVADVLEKIERVRQARRHKFYLRDERITLSHGSGGKATHNLIEGVFAPAFSNPLLDPMDDSAILDFGLPILDLAPDPNALLPTPNSRVSPSPPTRTW